MDDYIRHLEFLFAGVLLGWALRLLSKQIWLMYFEKNRRQMKQIHRQVDKMAKLAKEIARARERLDSDPGRDHDLEDGKRTE